MKEFIVQIYVNLTEEIVEIKGERIHPSGIVARKSPAVAKTNHGSFLFDVLVNLPAPSEFTTYIVSDDIIKYRNHHMPDRMDLVAPWYYTRANELHAAKQAKQARPVVDLGESHPCVTPGCGATVGFDDEPHCFTHSPDSGSSVPGYSYKAVSAASK